MRLSEINDKNFAIVRIFENRALKIENVFRKYKEAIEELETNETKYNNADYVIIQLKYLKFKPKLL
ncbi:hypothetical protein [[Mycoplasma] anseris]|uniref:Uncharacterized protein n=1 Tax=[Mycoplasma] anseris TaxID=92400 RepID=A0A2Z4ND49_9BACT|nr:hypothetical protein [[Mycoplasma] anseris]AWX69416.1 hypothetical protein DP065_01445 [[Mycoplasma] anseris]